MSRPHAFAFRRYSFNTSTIPSPELTQPVQQYNTTGDSHHAAEMLPRLQALRREALGHASAVGTIVLATVMVSAGQSLSLQ